jgi:hypothetical protein
MASLICLSSPDGTTISFIPLNVNLEVLLILATFFALWLYFVELYVYLMQGRWVSYCRQSPRRAGHRRATVLFLLGGLLATTGIGFADLKNHLIWHRVFGFFGLNFFNFYVGLTYVTYKPNMSRAGSIYRIAVMVSAWGNFIVAAFAEFMFSTRTCITLSTYGEYGLLLSLYAYILSYYPHLRASQLTLFYVE